MTNRPLLLDLFCCAGGASQGYYDAGFAVIGVDIDPQPHYPFPFIQGDAMLALAALVGGKRYMTEVGTFRLEDFAAFHGSPPCQKFSILSRCRPGLADTYPNLIPQTRELFKATGKPYVIENVPGSPLEPTVTLCGTMFGKRLRLHRDFEANFPIAPPAPCDHSGYVLNPNNYKGRARIREEFGQDICITEVWRNEKGVPWMTYHEASEAIMPAYTRHVGRHMRHELARRGEIMIGEAA